MSQSRNTMSARARVTTLARVVPPAVDASLRQWARSAAEAASREQVARIRSVLPSEWDAWPQSLKRTYLEGRAAVLTGHLSVAAIGRALGHPPTPTDLAAERELALLRPLLEAIHTTEAPKPTRPDVDVLPPEPAPALPSPPAPPVWMERLRVLLRPGVPPAPEERFVGALFSAAEESVLLRYLRVMTTDGDEPLPVDFRVAAQDFWERPVPARAERRGNELVLVFGRCLVWVGDVEVVAVKPVRDLGGRWVPRGSVVFRAPSVTLRYSRVMDLPARLLLALLAGKLEGGGYRLITHEPLGETTWAGPAGRFAMDPAWRLKLTYWRRGGLPKLVQGGWLDTELAGHLESLAGIPPETCPADRSAPEPPTVPPSCPAPDLAAALSRVIAGEWQGTTAELWVLLGGEDGPYPTPQQLGVALAAAEEHGLPGFRVARTRIGEQRQRGWSIRRE